MFDEEKRFKERTPVCEKVMKLLSQKRRQQQSSLIFWRLREKK
jgi:hypothetical protein